MIRTLVVTKEYDGYQVGRYLRSVMGCSNRSFKNLDVYVKGHKVKNFRKIVKTNNKVVVKELEKGTGIVPIEMNLNIAYEDKDLLIIDKPPFLVVHPTEKKTGVTLANGVVHYFQSQNMGNIVPRFFNRLDMNTTGLIIVAKNAYVQNYLQQSHKVKKYYKAIVHGIVDEDHMEIDIPIGRREGDLRRERMDVASGGQEAKTIVDVLARDIEANLTLVKCELITGRTHQIRAHMSILGHPLLGDELYGGADERVSRQMLHSYKCIFPDVNTGEPVTVEIDLPEDMRAFLRT